MGATDRHSIILDIGSALMSSMEPVAFTSQNALPQLFESTFELASSALSLLDGQGRILRINSAFTKLLGFTLPELFGKSFLGQLKCEYPSASASLNIELAPTDLPLELDFRRRDGDRLSVQCKFAAVGEQLLLAEIVPRKLSRRLDQHLEETRLHIFEKIAQGALLLEILSLVTNYIEQARPNLLTDIFLVDEDGRHLLPGAAPNLPPDCLEVLANIEIDARGICSTSEWPRIRVIAEDLSTAPYCDVFRTTILAAGFRACWSEPILDSSGNLLGIFWIYLRQSGAPTNEDLKLIHQASHIAAIAIERKRAETRLLKSEQRYRDIFDGSRDALFLLETIKNGQFCVIEANPALERSVGMTRASLIGKTIEEILPPTAATAAMTRSRYCLDNGSPLDEEVELDLPIGRLTFHSTLIPVHGVYGQRIIGIFRNITKRKLAERVLHSRAQEFRALVENSPDTIARFDLQFRFLYANPAARRMLGHPLTDLLGKRLSEAFPYANVTAPFQDKLEQIVRAGGTEEEEFALDTLSANGIEAIYYQVRLVPERDQHGELVSILAVGRDISAMRAAEQHLKESHAQLRQLSSRHETAREEECKRIAREVHDELGQQLTALRMGISLLRLQFGKDHGQLADSVQALMTRTDKIIQVVRNVASSLRPAALNMGLTSALEWLVSEFFQNTGIPCRLNAPTTRLDLDDERATAAFRVIQESLTNVARHAQAGRVDVWILHESEHVLIEVYDDGKGFDPEQLSKGTLGILGMHERGHMLGGLVSISSNIGKGTRVQLRIPL